MATILYNLGTFVAALRGAAADSTYELVRTEGSDISSLSVEELAVLHNDLERVAGVLSVSSSNPISPFAAWARQVETLLALVDRRIITLILIQRAAEPADKEQVSMIMSSQEFAAEILKAAENAAEGDFENAHSDHHRLNMVLMSEIVDCEYAVSALETLKLRAKALRDLNDVITRWH